MRVSFNNPPISKLIKENEKISRTENHYSYNSKNFKKEVEDTLISRISELYELWEGGTSTERKEIRDVAKYLNGNEEKTSFPFGPENSSQLQAKLLSGFFRVFRSFFRRAIFSQPNIITAIPKSSSNIPTAEAIKQEEAINWTAEYESNLFSILKDTDLPAFRDGSAVIFGKWEREVEEAIDYSSYENVTEFETDYPSAESAGLSSSKYAEHKQWLMEKQEKEDLQVSYPIRIVKKEGPTYKICDWANFVRFPFNRENVDELILYGYIFIENILDVKKKIKLGYYRKEAESHLDKHGEMFAPDWESTKEKDDGVNPELVDQVQLLRCVIKIDIDNDGIPERYTVICDPKKKQIYRIERYSIRRNTPDMIVTRLVKNGDSMKGTSLAKEVEQLCKEVDALHRHRSNVRRLTDSPTLIMPDTLKDQVGDDYFEPGRSLWVSTQNMASAQPKQLQLHNVDGTRQSMDEEQMLMKLIELCLGVTVGQSGQSDPTDPRAPGNKTQMLLEMANSRIMDLIEEWKRCFPELLRLHISLYAQNAKGKLFYTSPTGESKGSEAVSIKEFTNSEFEYALRANTISISPSLDMNRISMIAQFGGSLGVLQMQPELAAKLYNEYVSASRIADFSELSVDIEEMKQRMVQAQQQAQQQETKPNSKPKAKEKTNG